MNYRHIYHAGNFADVFKHLVLLALIEALKRKPKPFCVLDTHAGLGLYSLQSIEAQKKQEYQHGIYKLVNSTEKPPVLVQQYVSTVSRCNPPNKLEIYPGSSLLALNAMREETDKLIACELHPDDVAVLKKNILAYDNAAVHHMNGYYAMKAFLPPKEARGLVFIDPPFENTTEFDDVLQSLTLALKHWRSGVCAVWYPIKDRFKVNTFYHELSFLGFPTHYFEFSLLKEDTEPGMTSCGMAIVNMPWQVPELLNDEILPYLSNILDASYSMKSDNMK